jgi:hypothetical protein
MKSKLASWFEKRPVFWLFFLVNGFLWSWLFLIDVARLSKASNAAFTGYFTITVVYLIIVVLSSAIFTLAFRYLKREIKKPKWHTPLKIFVVWAFTEALVAWVVAIIWIGRNGSLDNILPFSSLTPLLMWTPLGFLARLVGFYGLSSAVITCLACLIVKSLRKYAPYYIGGLLVLTLLGWGIYRTATGPTTTVTIVAEQFGTPRPIESSGSKLVLIPEYGLDQYESSNVKDRVNSNADSIYIIGSKQIPGPNGFKNTLILASTDKGFLQEQAKARLIPGGEYLSYPVEVLLRVLDNNTYTDFQVRRAVAKGNKPIEPFKIDGLLVGSEACSSIINPTDYRNLTKKGATMLTNSASLEIFKGSRLFTWQHRGLAKFMATANARPFLQSSNNWPAFALDYNGKQLAEIKPSNTTQLKVITNTKKTPYTMLGEWVAFLGAVWLAVDFVKWRKEKSTK